MSGIFPSSGVPAEQATQAQANPDMVPGCEALYHSSTRCQPRFDPAAANAVVSEIVNLVNCAELPYDCSKLDNLCTAVSALIDKRVAELPPNGVSTQALGQTVFSDPQTIIPNMQLKAETTPSPLVNIAGGSVEVEEGTYLLAGSAAVYFESNSGGSGQFVPYFLTARILINGVVVQSGNGLALSRVGFTGNGTPTAAVPAVIRRINPGDLISMEVFASTDNSGASTLIRLVPENTYLTLVKLKD